MPKCVCVCVYVCVCVCVCVCEQELRCWDFHVFFMNEWMNEWMNVFIYLFSKYYYDEIQLCDTLASVLRYDECMLLYKIMGSPLIQVIFTLSNQLYPWLTL